MLLSKEFLKILVVLGLFTKLNAFAIQNDKETSIIGENAEPKTNRLESLRQLMKNSRLLRNNGKNIDAYIALSIDSHQSEFTSPRDQRIAFISGFSGSTGAVVVTQKEALLWTDGRYFLQADKQLTPRKSWTLMKMGVPGTPTIEEWLAQNLSPRSTVATDPMIMSTSSWLSLQSVLRESGHSLVPTDPNLIDEIWDQRPAQIANPVVPQKIEYSGESAGSKIQKVREEMEKNGVQVLVISALDEVAYLLNWRGSDIPGTPVFFGYVVLTADEVHVFMDNSRVEPAALSQLQQENVNATFHPLSDVRKFLKSTCQSDKVRGSWISKRLSYAFFDDCQQNTYIKRDFTPVMLMKIRKNVKEIEGIRHSHIRDSVALVKFFSWLEDQVINNKSVVSEYSAAEELLKFRQAQRNFVSVSFPTISAFGKSGSQIHYMNPSKDIVITDKEFYLCDSGAQYLDGTTDVTRTLHFGEATDFEKECFTRVFKGQTAIATLTFPIGTKGDHFDLLARKSLWDVGLDYRHGTGHGIGSYLNVHEAPTLIRQEIDPDDPGFWPGTFVSNEPGYYEDGKFGIRFENDVLVKNATTKYNKSYNDFVKFETMTLVPIQTKNLKLNLLTCEEINHLNKYHKKIYKKLEILLQGRENEQALHWLKRETLPLLKPSCQSV